MADSKKRINPSVEYLRKQTKRLIEKKSSLLKQAEEIDAEIEKIQNAVNALK